MFGSIDRATLSCSKMQPTPRRPRFRPASGLNRSQRRKLDLTFSPASRTAPTCAGYNKMISICARLEICCALCPIGFWISSDLVLWHPNMKHQTHSPLNRCLASCAQYVSNDVNYIYCTVLFSWRPLVSSWMDAGSMASLRKICLWLSTSMRCVTRTWYDQTLWPDTAPIDPIHYS